MRVAVALRARDDVIGILLLGPPANGDGSYGPIRARARSGLRAAARADGRERPADVAHSSRRRKSGAISRSPPRCSGGCCRTRRRSVDAAALAAVSLPARSIGGDYFDFIDGGDRWLGIALADIAGKGIPAALIMSSVRMALRVLASEPGISLPDLSRAG